MREENLVLNKTYKTAFITGGAQRIGESIATHLAKSGYNIAIQYNKSERKAQRLQNKFESQNIKFLCYKFDFENDSKILKLFDKICKDLGNIDILINNASTFEFDTLKTSNEKIFDKHINVNLKAPFFLSQSFAKKLNKRKGLIINIIDQRVNNITPYFTSYTISKSGLYSLTKSLSLSLAPNIRVNGISPGPTLMSKNQTEQQFKRQIYRTPLKKQVMLEEINQAINYLIQSPSVTGEVLTLDSGQSLVWAHSKLSEPYYS